VVQHRILLQPIGKVPSDALDLLHHELSDQFRDSSFITAPSIDLPVPAFDRTRDQYLSPLILSFIHEKCTDRSFDKVLGICDVDAYSNGLNFVFGEAAINGRIAVVYLARLRQEFYGLKSDNSLFLERIVKEAAHELGHAFGLGHCPRQKCVMFFSNSLADTDRKCKRFCNECIALLYKR
jgi:archaemetzincin